MISQIFLHRIGLAVCATLLLAAAPTTDKPIPLHVVSPYFPIEATCAGVDGDVSATVDVDSKGQGWSIKIVREQPADLDFGASARAALKLWTFQPGHPGTYTAKIHFALDPDLAGRHALSSHEFDQLPPGPVIVRKVAPVYPTFAEAHEIQGDAVVTFDLGDDGVVSAADLYQEVPQNAGFGKAALEAVKKWTFAPGFKARYSVCVKFRLL